MTPRPPLTRIDFESPISAIKGMGPRRCEALADAGIATVGDLLYHLPLRYIDRSTILSCADAVAHAGTTCAVRGIISQTRLEPGRRTRFRIRVTDTGEEGPGIEVLWFEGATFMRQQLQKGKTIVVTGRLQAQPRPQMIHPHLELVGAHTIIRPYVPVYPLPGALRRAGIGQKTIAGAITHILDNCKHYPVLLPAAQESSLGFPSLQVCLRRLHAPDTPADNPVYRARLRYEELYRTALILHQNRHDFCHPGRSLPHPSETATQVESNLPFHLTVDQRKVIEELWSDARSPRRMHRLLQGDVGSGKTIVALFACLPALQAGLQVAWMCPTEVLAHQTLHTVSPVLRTIGISCGLLTGSLGTAARRSCRMGIEQGAIRMIIGTHTLLQPDVRFQRLGMAVIDEQHKFGARQRLQLQHKDPACDILTISATPIPQTLARTLYGDLDLVTLQGVPGNRAPVSTHIVRPSRKNDLVSFCATRIRQFGEKIFFIAPRINQDDGDERTQARDVKSIHTWLYSRLGAEISVGMLHGGLSPAQKARLMDAFSHGPLSVLVATSIVEVGIDVPAATVICIESPDRFGLSQLHQLRGRVGRGRQQGYCFLLVEDAVKPAALQRLQQFCKIHDGFEIARLDMLLRGPGEIAGFRQSGLQNLQFADLRTDADLFTSILAAAAQGSTLPG